MMNQCTIMSPMTLSGVGLHSGKTTRLTFKPALLGEGIQFLRIDCQPPVRIPVHPDSLSMDKGISRCTILCKGDVRVSTVEHVLAALHGLGIDHVLIEIDGEEIPGMDGSSREFVDALQKAGLKDLGIPKEIYRIKMPIVVESGQASVMVLPAEEFKVQYHLDYDFPRLKNQRFNFTLNSAEAFIKEVSEARTFCLDREAKAIRDAGLGLGANSQNTLIMTENGPLENQLRYDDECCRHKALDIIGDLYTLGFSIQGAVYGSKSGHALNRALVHQIMVQRNEHMNQASQRIFDIDTIKKILPHRYPFLFVDRVIEVEKGVKGIGIKNVTANDGFFGGHFPQKPVMPGVIMIEAMAQTAGVVVLTSGAHDGKVALFMAIDEVKFRRVVVPGDQLVMEVEIVRDRERTAQVKGVARVDGEIAVEAMMMFSYTDSQYLGLSSVKNVEPNS